eukprot:CAMPEP_0114553618 /NCGR_PEP_ID=MMETSP0114-20121206/7762_1 /TAXON_ID=31324 /ORGANISM="Goniomonas sp, Strain m" /LENGTH=354 /DNA_ID=CAMNT_0001738589 /DNA_START=13 /DNA_END=1074 /DNA_ORIENTATION=-
MALLSSDGQGESAEDCQHRTRGRLYYCGLFLVASLVALILGYCDPAGFLAKIPGSDMGSPAESQALAVLRFSFALFCFHLVLALVLLGRPKKGDYRHTVQYGMWCFKIPAFLALLVAAFAIPAEFYNVYDMICRVCSGFFILLQILILINFAYGWNEAWVAYDSRQWYAAILLAAGGMLALSLTGWILMFVYYGGNGCDLNNFFISFTLVMSVITTFVSIQVEHGALLPSATIVIYNTYLCWSAINGQESTECKRVGGSSQNTVLLLIGSIFVLLSLCYQALNAAKSEETLRTYESMEPKEDSSDTYNYTYFHTVFLLGAMYMAMLLTAWRNYSDAHVGQESDLSMWVKIASQW